MTDPFEQGTYRRLNQPARRRGRPPAAEARQPVQLWLLPGEYERLGAIATTWADRKLSRSHVLGLALRLLEAKLRELRQNMEGSGADLPLGLIDLHGLYLLWELPLPARERTQRFQLTLSERERWALADITVLLERAFSVNRSRVAGLAITYLDEQRQRLQAIQPSGPADLEHLVLSYNGHAEAEPAEAAEVDFDVS